MIFNSMFKTLVGKEVTVELKNDMSIRGKLHSVDQFLNVKLVDISVVDVEKYPHMVSSQGQWWAALKPWLAASCLWCSRLWCGTGAGLWPVRWTVDRLRSRV